MSTEHEQRRQHGRKKLPVSINDFETMRNDGYLYVDKTQDVYRMVTQGKFYFLSRPRRFGKSVLVTTLKCLFQGKKELFDGLWIAENGEWDWQEHPVILLDFTEISNTNPEQLERDLEATLARIAEDWGVQLESPLLGSKFSELVLEFAKKSGQRVAVLIDEYDKPIIDHLGKGVEELEIAKANRDLLKRFFGVLKGITIAPKLQFIFLTGISRFSKVSIFSELNNLDDISMSEFYASLLGYTQEELTAYFADELQAFAEKLVWSCEKLLGKLAEEYNGYRFSKKDLRVYNPCSILKALANLDFEDYWFETATPTFLIGLLQQEKYNIPTIEGMRVSRNLFNTFNVEKLQPEALLFQTGYLTIKEVRGRLYTLDYPNQEVKRAFTETLLLALAKDESEEIVSSTLMLAEYLQNENFSAFFEALKAIFASIPYDIETKRDEAYFHTIFYLMMTASGVDARSSVLTCKGRIDLALFFPDKIYIIEFKCKQSAEAAIQQIHEKEYAEPYRGSGKAITLIGINFNTAERNLAEWKIVTL